MNKVYKLTAVVIFPEGIAPGAGEEFNTKILAQNGKGQYLIRGTAMTGVLRHNCKNQQSLAQQENTIDTDYWFGTGSENDVDSSSKIMISDIVLDCESATLRTHNLINRHTGAVAKGALYSLESLLPGTTGKLSLTIQEDEQSAKPMIDSLMTILFSQLLVGGSSNRGIGRMEIQDEIYLQEFDLNSVEGMSTWLDTQYKERKIGISLEGEKTSLTSPQNKLQINIKFGIPRGEDLLIGNGQESDFAAQPQKTTLMNGDEYWRIPGSSLRGVIKSWMTRLAARDGYNIKDSNDNWNTCTENEDYKPDLIGWGFKSKEERKKYQGDPVLINDPILDIFGSMYKKSRLHISDSYSSKPIKKTDTQERIHVAIDRFSGGANEGALFKNKVLINQKDTFSTTITFQKPKAEEIEWLIKTLRAIHLGIITLGSSKSSGRLEIKSILAKGIEQEQIQQFSQEMM